MISLLLFGAVCVLAYVVLIMKADMADLHRENTSLEARVHDDTAGQIAELLRYLDSGYRDRARQIRGSLGEALAAEARQPEPPVTFTQVARDFRTGADPELDAEITNYLDDDYDPLGADPIDDGRDDPDDTAA